MSASTAHDAPSERRQGELNKHNRTGTQRGNNSGVGIGSDGGLLLLTQQPSSFRSWLLPPLRAALAGSMRWQSSRA